MLVDVGRVSDLSYIRDGGDHVAIGALTRHHELATSDLLARECGVIAAVAAEVGDPQVRHRGTLGGSVAHGDPASDLPAVLLALDATVVARGSSRRANDRGRRSLRRLPRDLARGPTSCSPRSASPRPEPSGFSYQKFNRRAQDWATVGAVAVRTNGATHVALVNMGTTPLRASAVEAALAARLVDRRSRRTRGRRHRASRRSQRHPRVPRATSPRARAPRPRSRVDLSQPILFWRQPSGLYDDPLTPKRAGYDADASSAVRGANAVHTSLCDTVGIEYPIFAFTHCRDVVGRR